jgi:hypothetical protein
MIIIGIVSSIIVLLVFSFFLLERIKNNRNLKIESKESEVVSGCFFRQFVNIVD